MSSCYPPYNDEIVSQRPKMAAPDAGLDVTCKYSQAHHAAPWLPPRQSKSVVCGRSLRKASYFKSPLPYLSEEMIHRLQNHVHGHYQVETGAYMDSVRLLLGPCGYLLLWSGAIINVIIGENTEIACDQGCYPRRRVNHQSTGIVSSASCLQPQVRGLFP